MKNHLIAFLAIVTIMGTGALGYPQWGRLMPDGAPVPENPAFFEDSMAAASEVHTNDDDDKDDSDMYMEPDGAETSHGGTSDEPASAYIETVTSSSVSVSQRIPNGEEIPVSATLSEPRATNTIPSSQHLYTSFADLLAKYRYPINEQQNQQQYRTQSVPNRYLGNYQRERVAYRAAAPAVRDTHRDLLGSGNFRVIRGGTYYPDEKDNVNYNFGETLYSRNTQPNRNGEPFADFRDFADINTPRRSSFSHMSVVYANKNGMRSNGNNVPRNIIEHLSMLENQPDYGVNGPIRTTTVTPMKKRSQGKRKLDMMKKYHDDKARKIRPVEETLLALS